MGIDDSNKDSWHPQNKQTEYYDRRGESESMLADTLLLRCGEIHRHI